MNEKLSVLSNGKTRFPNLQSLDGIDGGSRRFIGWQDVNGKLEAKKEAEQVPASAEYIRAVQLGDLLPADQLTADLCSVPFKK